MGNPGCTHFTDFFVVINYIYIFLLYISSFDHKCTTLTQNGPFFVKSNIHLENLGFALNGTLERHTDGHTERFTLTGGVTKSNPCGGKVGFAFGGGLRCLKMPVFFNYLF